MTIYYGIAICIIIIVFDVINWLYFYLIKSTLNNNSSAVFNKGFFKGYYPIIISCFSVVFISLINYIFSLHENYKNLSNLIVGTVFTCQIFYIFFIRPKAIFLAINTVSNKK
jgi:hypothetical protein